MEIKPEPRMNESEVVALHTLLDTRRPRRVLEWGGGGSTLYWPAAYPDIDWVTIEHDPAWLEGLKASAGPNVKLLYLAAPDYYTITPAAVGFFDSIIVDALHRVKCLSQARNLLAPGGVVVLHDSSRPKWRPGWEYYTQVTQAAPPEKGRRGLVLLDKPRPTKVFGVGLSKTGTVSLTTALAGLGFKAKHFPAALDILRVAEAYDALTDSSLCQYLEILDRLYPGAKFVLTVREEERWLDSCRRHWAGRKPRTPGWEWNRRVVYGVLEYNEVVFRRVYHEYNRRVLDYFDGRDDKLLVLNIAGGEGYEQLCPFLNLPVSDKPFPHRNAGGKA
jgi:SAM-dependent methyltransferase